MAKVADRQTTSGTTGEQSLPPGKEASKERREISGGFPYTQSPGVLGKAVAGLIISERPTNFDIDFLSTVIGVSGGSARAVPPILKRAGLLGQDGTPTERYAQFQSDNKRAAAALDALRNGWPELFRKNRYAHKLDKNASEDLFVEITGLKRNDPIFRAITSTYGVFHEYAKAAPERNDHILDISEDEDPKDFTVPLREPSAGIQLGLTNQINIVLPETTDITVYNSIFRSLREHLIK